MRHVDDQERRARLGRRHAVAPYARVGSPEEAARAVVALHATEPPSVHLAVAARTEGVGVADVERALYDDRTLVKQLAMRRTLFAFPRDLLPAVWGSASARVAGFEQRKIAQNVEAAGLAADGLAWLREAGDAIAALLADGEAALSAQQVREAVPMVDVRVSAAPGTKYGDPIPVAPRVLTWLGASARVVRGRNAGHWRTSRPAWTSVETWLGAPAEPLAEDAGYRELVRRWLAAFGPGTETDLAWWLGSTKTAVRRALADLGAEPVSLDGGGTGWLLPDDLDPVESGDPWAALLPVLDPTTMGWKERDFYLDPADRPFLFDTAGNGGTTAWVDGRIVGCWVQDEDARVVVVPRGRLTAPERRLLAVEAERLTDWLGGVRIASVYKSEQMRRAPLP